MIVRNRIGDSSTTTIAKPEDKASNVPDNVVSNDVLSHVYHTRGFCQSDSCSLDDALDRFNSSSPTPHDDDAGDSLIFPCLVRRPMCTSNCAFVTRSLGGAVAPQ